MNLVYENYFRGVLTLDTKNIGTGRDECRVPLYLSVPLEVPYTVGVGVSDFCNFKCIYCAHSLPSSDRRKEKMLSFREFAKIADDLKELCNINNVKIKNFSICGTGEPLTCKNLPQMVEYAKEGDFSERIEITTNGSLLTHELSDKLIDAGLTRLLVSIQGINADAYNRICGYDINFEKLIDEIRYFYEHKKQCKIYIKTLDIALKENEKEKFYDIFSPIADMVNIEHMEEVFEGVDYNSIVSEKSLKQTRYGYAWQNRKCCEAMFMRMNINTDGTVDACGCHQPALSIGNMHRKSLKQIWNGDLHRRYMEMHLTGNRKKIKVCKDCDMMSLGGHPMDDLDGHLEDILKKVKNME